MVLYQIVREKYAIKALMLLQWKYLKTSQLTLQWSLKQSKHISLAIAQKENLIKIPRLSQIIPKKYLFYYSLNRTDTPCLNSISY